MAPGKAKWSMIRSLPLAAKMVLLTLLAGLLIWFVRDEFASRGLRQLFQEHLLARLQVLAARDRLSLTRFILSYPEAVELLVSQAPLHQYLTRMDADRWRHELRFHPRQERVAWLPSPSVLRTLPPIAYFLLLDGEGHLREVTRHQPPLPPRELIDSPELYLSLSLEQEYMTVLSGQPFILSSHALEADGRRTAHLMIATPFDADFLNPIALHQAEGETVIAVLTGQGDNAIIASSTDRTALPPGLTLGEARARFLVTGLEKFDGGSSEISIQFASFIARADMDAMSDVLLGEERKARLLSAMALIGSFLLVALWLTRRIERLNQRVGFLAHQVLGHDPEPVGGGDQLLVLESRFQSLVQEILVTHEELRQSSEAIAENAGRMRAVVENVADGIITVNAEGIIESVNPAAERIFGRKAETLLGGGLVTLMPAEMWESHQRGFARYLATGQGTIHGQVVEVPGVRADGSRFPMELEVGEVLHRGRRLFVGILRDITERKEREAQAAVRDTERLFRETLENIHLIAINLDLDGRIRFCNDYLLRLTGWNREEVLGQDWFSRFLPSERQTEARSFFDMTVELGREIYPYSFLNTLLTRQGEELRVSWQTTFLRDRGGKAVLKAYIGEDVTERERQAMRLREAKQAAEAANRSKTHFLANVSHEIRTPLNAIVGFAQILLRNRESFPVEYAHFLENIQTSGRNLSELISNVLDLSKIESGRMTVNMEEVRLRLLFQGIYHINKAEALKKSLDYRYQWEAGTPETILSDRTFLNQIFMNLLGNAIKFSPPGGQVVLEAARRGEWLQFILEDEGPGISPEDRERIFQPFEQATPATRGEYGGSGLGLSIARKAVELLGGRIALESAGERGSRFTVELPCVEVQATREAVETDDAGGQGWRVGSRVLVVEDNPLTREMMEALLTDLRLSVILAENGEEGVRTAVREQPELILMDLAMPVLDGVAAARRLREEGVTTPIIAITADAFQEQKERALAAGMNEFLAKPVDDRKLCGILNRYLPPLADGERPEVALPPLPAEVEETVREGLRVIGGLPGYEARRIVEETRRLMELTLPYGNPYARVLREIAAAVHARKAERIPEMVAEALKKAPEEKE